MPRVRRRNLRPKEVFLSHAAKDRRFVKRLATVLRRHGIEVWYSEHGIHGARQWNDEIGDALDRCDWMVVVLSPAAVRSRWVKREVMFAIRERRFDDRIVPIIVQSCNAKKLNWVLPQLQMLMFTRRFKPGCQDLLRAWGIEYKP